MTDTILSENVPNTMNCRIRYYTIELFMMSICEVHKVGQSGKKERSTKMLVEKTEIKKMQIDSG